MRTLTCFAVLVVVGCKSDEEKIIEAHRGALKAQFEKIVALAPKVEKEPKLAAERWPVPGVRFSENIFTDPSGNALLAWSHQLVDACANENVTFEKDNSGDNWIFFSDSRVSTASTALNDPKCALDGKMDQALGLNEKQVKYVAAAKYLLVLRPHMKVLPTLDEAERKASVDAYLKGDKSKNVEHFAAGRLAGDALLYELSSGALLGGFLFDATSSNAITIDRDYKEMNYDIARNLQTQLVAKLRN